MYFEWTPKFNTGIEKIDNQHKKLMALMNDLYDDIIMNKDTKKIDEAIMDLKLYTIFHFYTEENLFKKYKYSGEDYQNHIKKHEDFTIKIVEFLSDETSTQIEKGYRIFEFLKNWLAGHILSTDMQFARYVKQNFFKEISEDDIYFDD
jgi:hemerythrin-like metal-binding protein